MRLFAWVGLVLGFTYIVAAGGGGWDGTYTASFRLFSIGLTALALLAWAIAARRSPSWRPASAVWPAVVAVAVAFVVSTLWSWNRRLSIEMTAYAILLIGLYLLLRQLFRQPFFERRILGLGVAMGLVVSLLFLAQVAGLWLQWWSITGQVGTPPLRPGFVGLTYGGPNAVATVDVLLLAPSVAFIGVGSRRQNLLVGALIVLSGLVVIASGSRGAWLGVAAALAVTTVLLLARRGLRSFALAALNRRAVAAIAVGGAALAVGAVAIGPAVMTRLLGGGGETLRASLVAVSVRMFTSAPLTGSGPGTWAARRESFTQPGEVDYYIPHAHNMYAQTLAEFGVVGIIAGVVVLASLAWLIRGALTRPDPLVRRMAVAAFFGLAFLAGQQVVDFYPNLPAALLAIAIPIAWLDARTQPFVLPRRIVAALPSPRSPRTGRVVATGSAALVAASLLFLTWSDLHSLTSDRLATITQAEDWEAAYGPALQLARDDPEIPVYHFVAGLAAAHVGDLGTAATELQRSVGQDDYAQGWLDLAGVELAAGQTDAARQALDRALRLGAMDVSVAFPAGALLLQMGDANGAAQAFTNAIVAAPSLAGDAYWQTGPGSAVSQRVFDQAIARGPTASAFEIALESGQTAAAATFAAALFGDDRTVAQLVLAAWGGDETAFQTLQQRARDNPFDTGALAWSARLAQRAGDPAAAAHFRTLLDLQNIFTAVGNGVEVRISADGGTSYVGGQPQPGLNNAWSYGIFSYLRTTTYDVLVPQVLHLVQQ